MLLAGGGTVDETIEFLLAGGTGRAMLDQAEPEATARAVDAVRMALAAHHHEDGVRLGAATRVATARRARRSPPDARRALVVHSLDEHADWTEWPDNDRGISRHSRRLVTHRANDLAAECEVARLERAEALLDFGDGCL